jgi:hypothetical protein
LHLGIHVPTVCGQLRHGFLGELHFGHFSPLEQKSSGYTSGLWYLTHTLSE